MKSKQIIISLLSFVMLSICLCGCRNDASSNTTQEVQSNDSTQTSNAGKTANADSIKILRNEVKQLTEKVDTISYKLSEVEGSLVNDSKTIKIHKYIIFIVVAFIIILGIFVIVVNKKIKKLNERLDRHRSDIDSCKRDLNTNALDYQRKDRNAKTKQIEDDYKKSSKPAQGSAQSTPSTSHTSQAKSTKIGYFGAAINAGNGDGYFKNMIEVKDGDARFSAKITNGSAEFEPIVNISSIKSYDYMDLALEFKGVSKNEATNMTTLKKGLAIQKKEKWVITQKAVINLTK